MNKEFIKIYLTKPSYIMMDIRCKVMKIKNKVYKFLYNKLIEKRLRSKYYTYKPTFLNYKSSTFYPCQTVFYVLDHYFDNLENLIIHGINVIKEDDLIKVSIRLRYPSMLIGKNGKDINAIQDKLTNIFGIKTIIDIEEINLKNFY